MTIEKSTGYELVQVGLYFTSLPNTVINMIQNPDALAIWVYLCSKPRDWIVRPDDLMNRFDIGRDRYWKAMKELRALQLVWDFKVKDGETGKILSNKIVCSNLPMDVLEKLGIDNPESTKALLEKPGLPNSVGVEETRPTGFRSCGSTGAPVKPTPYKERKDLYKELIDDTPKGAKQQIKKWSVSEVSVNLLMQMHQIPATYIRQQEAEFKIYWQDDGSEVTSWDSKFISRCVSQWRKEGHLWQPPSSVSAGKRKPLGA